MIYLVTGTPGAGKTAYIVAHKMLPAAEQGRPIFSMGIPELKVPHLETPPISEWTELRESPEEPGLMLPYFTFAQNSMVVIDECQRIYRLRPNGSKVPDHVAALETHRHTGIDIVLMTQHPQLVDVNVRRLVGCHIHLRDVGLLGRWRYEWPECTDVGQFRSAPIKAKYKLPKQAFALYKSSSLHIKPSRSVPPVLIFLGAAIIAAAFLGWNAWQTIGAKVTKKEPTAETRQSSGVIPQGQGTQQAQTPEQVLMELTPRVFDRPETAPIYDSLRVAKEMPQIVGCIVYQDACSCYTQQGTKAIVSKPYCEAWMDHNRPFNPYREPPQQVAASEPRQSPQRVPSVHTAPGNPPEWFQPLGRSPVDNTASNTPQASPQPMQGSPQGLAGQPG